jgi:hypothetical protein
LDTNPDKKRSSVFRLGQSSREESLSPVTIQMQMALKASTLDFNFNTVKELDA